MQLDPREQWIASRPDFYVATVFKGRGQYNRMGCASLDGARQAAQILLRDSAGRPAAIYAVRDSAQACIELVAPRRNLIGQSQ